MENKIIYILGGVAVIGIVIIVFFLIKPIVNLPNLKTKLQQCPEEWIDDQMPTADLKKSETQYFILNGERRELYEFNEEWIQKNCSIKKQTVF